MEAAFVTILFTDLVGSTELFVSHGDDAADAIRREHFGALRRAVAEHGGNEVKSTGDGLMVAFGSTVAAVRCAMDLQRATKAAPGDLRLRVGLDAGEPIREGDDLYGTPVIVASRLCNAAAPGEILASALVASVAGPRVKDVLQPAGEMQLKGLDGPIAVARVRWDDTPTSTTPPAPGTAAPQARAGVEFRMLGPLEILHDGVPVPVPGVRQREMLAVFLLHSGQQISTDRLMDALWGENQPTTGVAALRVRVSQLRKALRGGGELLVTRPTGYALMVEPERIDLHRFERHLDTAERALATGDPASAGEHARSALELWRGRPLADLAYAPFAQSAIVRLEELHAAAQELRIEAELALGRHSRLVSELQALADANPLRERLWAQLMLALYRDGRQAEALATYRLARTRLVEEIGIEPGPQLQRLEQRILAQDPDLGGAAEQSPSPQRAVLAIGAATAPLAERLAARAGHELLVFDLLEKPDEVSVAARELGRLREQISGRGVEARVAAFTTADRGADAVRLAREHEAALLVIEATPDLLAKGRVTRDLETTLRDAVCDVAVLAGADRAGGAGGPVAVPFSGHEHDWAAVEIGAWLAGNAPLRLLGVQGDPGQDASRLLASASLALQRGMGIVCEPVLVEKGSAGIVQGAQGAAALVVGLSDRWRREGAGKARAELARTAPCPVLLVRGGLRPSGLAPAHAMTRFTWSGGSG